MSTKEQKDTALTPTGNVIEQKPVIIPEADKKKALESALYYLQSQQPFYGSLMQEITIKYMSLIPTACITFNPKQEQYEIYLNPEFFVLGLTADERVAVLHHEILHFTNKHLFRLPFMNAKEEDRKLYNMAGDMAINQYISPLPEGCIDVKQWHYYDNNGNKTAFPVYKNMESYYDLLKEEEKKEAKGDDKKHYKGKGGASAEQFGKYKEFDKHDWDQLSEEDKEKMLNEAKKIIKRTIEKTQFGHSSVPDGIKDLLEEIEGLTATLNYKNILKKAIKRTVSVAERENSWNRRNKRYGAYSPGTRVGNLPKLGMYADTSGSISHKELNEFLQIISNFLQVGTRECMLNLWHTELYYKKKYKLRQTITREDVQSGGTDIGCVMADIHKNKPDMSIVLTDGYYDTSSITPTGEVIFIISHGGNENHPMRHVGKTIPLDKLKDD